MAILKQSTRKRTRRSRRKNISKFKKYQKRIYELFLKYFLDFAALFPFLRHKTDIKNNKDIIIKDLKNKTRCSKIPILDHKCNTPERQHVIVLNKYDPYTLLKSHFTLNFIILENIL
jgi:hypothetical protein